MKNKHINRYGRLAVCLLMMTAIKAVAQTDPHFTQNYTYPLYINPALAGSADGTYRASAIYRSQWGSLSSLYRTVGVSFDTRTNKNAGLGINLLNQSAGDGGFNYLTLSGSYAYTGVKFGKDYSQRIVMALQGGIISRRVNPAKFKWGEQWNPITGYQESNPTTQTFSKTFSIVPDIGAGILYFDASSEKKYNLFGGFSAYHLNRPKDPIVTDHQTDLNRIPVRYSMHGGVSFNISSNVRVIPHVLYMRQGTAFEAMAGFYTQINVDEQTDFMLGGYYRVKDAIAPYVGIDYKNFVIGLSYDANASGLRPLTKNVNSFELTLSYIKRSGTKSIVDFVRCARL